MRGPRPGRDPVMVFIGSWRRATVNVLAVSSVMPAVKNISTVAYARIFASLRERGACEESWAVSQPDSFAPRHDRDRRVVDTHGYADGMRLLGDVRPDCVLVNSRDFVNAAMSLAARRLGIPVFLLHTTSIDQIPERRLLPRLRWMLRNLLMDKTQTDSAADRRFMRKGRHIAYKLSFLYRTLRAAGTGPASSLVILWREIMLLGMGRTSRYGTIQDGHFVAFRSTVDRLVGAGVDRGSILVAESIIWDVPSRGEDTVEHDPGGPKRVLIITSPLYEHGEWSRGTRDDFVSGIVSGLRGDPGLEVSLKAHPSSEDAKEYGDLLGGSLARLYHRERLSDIIRGFDVAVSYGHTGAQTEVVAGGTRLVRINLDRSRFTPPLVDEGIKSGIVTTCDSPGDVAGAVRDALAKRISLTDAFVAESGSLYSGDAAGRIADVVMGAVSGKKP